jgi:protein-S-isoprenylcysteine O-methyltransferase Ste14
MPERPTDMREYRKKLERRLVVAVMVALLVVGSVVIGLVYGWQSILTGLICLVPGAAILGLLWLLLNWLERFVDR